MDFQGNVGEDISSLKNMDKLRNVQQIASKIHPVFVDGYKKEYM